MNQEFLKDLEKFQLNYHFIKEDKKIIVTVLEQNIYIPKEDINKIKFLHQNSIPFKMLNE